MLVGFFIDNLLYVVLGALTFLGLLARTVYVTLRKRWRPRKSQKGQKPHGSEPPDLRN